MSSPVRINDNPLSFVNQMVIGIYEQISGLESELSKAVDRDPTNTGRGPTSFMELYDNVHDIKTKAAQSEAIIQQILRDREKCDFAKGRLIGSSEAVTQLTSLTQALNQLELELNTNFEYKRVAELLESINRDLESLSKYVLLSRLDGVKDRVETTKLTIKRKIFRSFREIGQIMDGVDASKVAPDNVSTQQKSHTSSDIAQGAMTNVEYTDNIITSLANAADVIDSLGDDVREELLDELVQTQMLPYDRIGRRGGTIGTLAPEHMERRWTGLRKLLYAAEHRMGRICPAKWMLPHRIYLEFTERTRAHFRELLMVEQEKYEMRGSDNGEFNSPAAQAHVSTIVNTLKSVIKVEEEMMNKFEDMNNDYYGSFSALSEMEEDIIGSIEDGQHISRVFDEFMGPYILLERSNLEVNVERLISQDLSGSYDYGNYESSSRMFEYIRQSMKRCLALTNGKSFLELVLEYQPCIQLYAETLRSRCPHTGKGNSSGSRIFQHKMSPDEEITVCRVLNTAEYCTDVVPKLESQIKEKIHFTYESQVDFSEQIDLFTDVVSDAIGVLVGGVLGQTDNALKIMKKMHWAGVSDVGDESPYLAMIHCAIVDCIPRLRKNLSSIYFKKFCTDYSSEFLSQYLQVIMSQKKICKVGAEQLLLDTNVLKTMIMKLHSLGECETEEEKEKSQVPAIYETIMLKKFRHIEVVLKLVCTDEEHFEEMFAILHPEGTDEERFAIAELQHNPSLFKSVEGHVGEISQSTVKAVGGISHTTVKAVGGIGHSTAKAVGGVGSAVDNIADEIGDTTKKAFDVTSKSFRALGAVSSSSWSKLKSSTNKVMKRDDH